MSAVNKVLIIVTLLALCTFYILMESNRYDVKTNNILTVLVDKHTGHSWLLLKEDGRYYWRPILTYNKWLRLVELEDSGALDSLLEMFDDS